MAVGIILEEGFAITYDRELGSRVGMFHCQYGALHFTGILWVVLDDHWGWSTDSLKIGEGSKKVFDFSNTRLRN